MMLYFGTCISHFGADTPCFWSAYSPHWCEAASGLAIALLPWIPFQFVWLLGQVYVFSPMTKDSSFCRTPLSTSSKTTRTNMSFNLSLWNSGSRSWDTSLLVIFLFCLPACGLQKFDWGHICLQAHTAVGVFSFLQVVNWGLYFLADISWRLPSAPWCIW